jgi:hypothetical protein
MAGSFQVVGTTEPSTMHFFQDCEPESATKSTIGFDAASAEGFPVGNRISANSICAIRKQHPTVLNPVPVQHFRQLSVAMWVQSSPVPCGIAEV